MPFYFHGPMRLVDSEVSPKAPLADRAVESISIRILERTARTLTSLGRAGSSHGHPSSIPFVLCSATLCYDSSAPNTIRARQTETYRTFPRVASVVGGPQGPSTIQTSGYW